MIKKWTRTALLSLLCLMPALGAMPVHAAEPLAIFECPLPNPAMGKQMVVHLYADAKASLTIEGAVIGGARDPKGAYSYVESGADFKLTPASAMGQQIGPFTLTNKGETLSFDKKAFSMACNS